MHLWIHSLCLFTTMSGLAPAQTTPADSQPPLLTGPSVAESNITALNSNFVEPENQRDRMGGGMDARFLREFIASLRESNDPELRLTPEQQQEIGAIARDHQAKMTEFERTHARELRRLRGQAGQPGRRADAGAPVSSGESPSMEPMDKMAPDTTARIAELEALRPNPADMQKRLRAVLNEHQRQALDERIAAAMKERSEQRQMEQIRKEVTEQMARQTPATLNLDRLPPRIRERIEALPPEERPAALERLREQYAARGQADRAPSGADKPAPSMKDVDVPRPGGG